MTSIDPLRFSTDMARASFSADHPPDAVRDALVNAGVDPALLATAVDTDGDHVVHGAAECAVLYRLLVEAEARRNARGPPDAVDRVQAVYDAIKASMPPEAAATPPIAAGTSSRTRSAGLLALRPAVPALVPEVPRGASPEAGSGTGRMFGGAQDVRREPRGASPEAGSGTGRMFGGAQDVRREPRGARSELVRLHGGAAAERYRAGAERNAAGPEAAAESRILSMTESAARDIESLEAAAARLPRDSAERRAIEAKIDAAVREFDRRLEGDRYLYDPRPPPSGGNALDPVLRALPPYLRESVHREGVVIPGVPGSIAPRFGRNPGIDWRFKF